MALLAPRAPNFLADQILLYVGAQKALLMHGDSLCTDDVGYQRFRRGTRYQWLQRVWYALPRGMRHQLVTRLRERSRKNKSGLPAYVMDVNANAVLGAMHNTEGFRDSGVLIHGHTHRPQQHQHGSYLRYVLPDWEYDTDATPRGGGLRFDKTGIYPLAA